MEAHKASLRIFLDLQDQTHLQSEGNLKVLLPWGGTCHPALPSHCIHGGK